jgi:hypothetical protein
LRREWQGSEQHWLFEQRGDAKGHTGEQNAPSGAEYERGDHRQDGEQLEPDGT